MKNVLGDQEPATEREPCSQEFAFGSHHRLLSFESAQPLALAIISGNLPSGNLYFCQSSFLSGSFAPGSLPSAGEFRGNDLRATKLHLATCLKHASEVVYSPIASLSQVSLSQVSLSQVALTGSKAPFGRRVSLTAFAQASPHDLRRTDLRRTDLRGLKRAEKTAKRFWARRIACRKRFEENLWWRKEARLPKGERML